ATQSGELFRLRLGSRQCPQWSGPGLNVGRRGKTGNLGVGVCIWRGRKDVVIKPRRVLCSKVTTWLQLQIPRIEDGNNFGVAVQVRALSPQSTALLCNQPELPQLSTFFLRKRCLS
ncbi:proteasome (prosome, macropain) 28 subunit, alpha, isoform CRA_a, partial [Mus musculus]